MANPNEIRETMKELESLAGKLHSCSYTMPKNKNSYIKLPTYIEGHHLTPNLDGNGRIVDRPAYADWHRDSVFWPEEYKEASQRYNTLMDTLKESGASRKTIAQYSEALMATGGTQYKITHEEALLKKSQKNLANASGIGAYFTPGSGKDYKDAKNSIESSNRFIDNYKKELNEEREALHGIESRVLIETGKGMGAGKEKAVLKDLPMEEAKRPGTGESHLSQPVPEMGGNQTSRLIP